MNLADVDLPEDGEYSLGGPVALYFLLWRAFHGRRIILSPLQFSRMM